MGGTDKTSWLEGMEHDEEGAFTDDGGFTESLGGWSDGPRGGDPEGRTVALGTSPGDKTAIMFGGLGSKAEDPVEDPVTGWLVVIEGPGLGRSVQVGAGMNALGRLEEERVALPFGDMQISGRDHVRIIYDDEDRSFLIAPGAGKNVSRVNGQIVAAPMPLPSQSVIQLSKNTRVRFVAFCSKAFDWSDVVGDSKA